MISCQHYNHLMPILPERCGVDDGRAGGLQGAQKDVFTVSAVIPAKAGIQFSAVFWAPASAGVTNGLRFSATC